MAETYTSNLELVKPDYNSPADIFVINSNMDKIDNAVANAGKVKSVNGKTGDVSLSASDVGALPSDGTAVNATQLNGKSAEYYATAEQFSALNQTTNAKLSMDLLWANDSPGSEFAAQTIPLNLTDYDAVEVVFRYVTSQETERHTKCSLNRNGIVSFVGNTAAAYIPVLIERKFSVTSNQVSFEDCYTKDTNAKDYAVSAKFAIPFKIYGIKGVS